jgi:hypothetical protein
MVVPLFDFHGHLALVSYIFSFYILSIKIHYNQSKLSNTEVYLDLKNFDSKV